MGYHMLETMYVRCAHCGYDNSPEYRFCGMCGASLARQPAEPKPAPRQAPPLGSGVKEEVPVTGPSFLGLSEDPKTEFHYLYEDEPQRSHVGVAVFLIIILGAAGFLGWQWKQGGFPFNRQAGSASNSSGVQQSASPSEVAPAMTQNQETHIDKPMTGAGNVLPTQPDQNTPSAANKPAPPTEKDLPAANANSAGDQNDQKQAEKKAAPEENTTEEAKAVRTPAPAPAKPRGTSNASTRPRVPKAVAPAPATPSAAAAAPDADLEQAGERYLYGTGFPQNCPRAESSLRTAATHGNTKAQTVLGTMYATGHCVGRDLPTAYRWFARALHQEPQNSRISADLQVLWRQMTQQEKQLATASGQ
jgi:hypothetical protein